MAGHSAWANIKHRKAAQDKKKGKIFTKLIKEITVAAKLGGTDPSANPRLRAVLASARKISMSRETIDKALKKAAGPAQQQYEEVSYEGYGVDGVAIFIECQTDNLIRTIANIRSYFNKYGGSIGKDGCLQFVFEQKAVITFRVEASREEEITMGLIDAGADDVQRDGELVTALGPMTSFARLQECLEQQGITPENAALERIALNHKEISKDSYLQVMKLIDVLEDDDDVKQVYHNIQYSEDFEGLA